MKILFIYDISGAERIRAVKVNVKTIIKKEKIHYVIANAENTTKGRGLNFTDYNKLKDYGINFLLWETTLEKKKTAKLF